MSEFADNNLEIEAEEIEKLLEKVGEQDFVELPQTTRLQILQKVLELTQKFLLDHRYTDSENGRVIYWLGDNDEKLYKIYTKISEDLGRLQYEEPARQEEISAELELTGQYLIKMDSEGLEDYREAVQKRIEEKIVKN